MLVCAILFKVVMQGKISAKTAVIEAKIINKRWELNL